MADIADGIATAEPATPVAPAEPTAPVVPTYQDDGEVTGQLIENKLPEATEPMSVEDMKIPLRAPEAEEPKEEAKEEPDDGGGTAAKDDGPDGSEAGDTKEAPEAPKEEPAPTAPVTQVEVEDPGEFKPGDHSFEVTLKGKTQKITSLEEADKLADDPENFSTPKELMDFLNKQQDMRYSLQTEKRDYDSKKEAFDTYAEQTKHREETLQGWENELNYLVDQGKLPKLSASDETANWADPEVAKHPGVKERNELLAYIGKENAMREKAGLSPIQSMLDAFNSMQFDTNQTQAKAEVKAEGEVRKAKGSMVGGNTPSQPTRLPKDVLVGEGGSLNDLSDYAFL